MQLRPAFGWMLAGVKVLFYVSFQRSGEEQQGILYASRDALESNYCEEQEIQE